MTAALALAVLALAYAAAPARAQRCGAQAGGALCPQQPLMLPVRLLRPQLRALRRRLPEPVRPRRRGGASEATAAVRRARGASAAAGTATAASVAPTAAPAARASAPAAAWRPC